MSLQRTRSKVHRKRSRGQILELARNETDWASAADIPKSETATRLFNGRDFSGWEGQVAKYWFVENGAIRAANDREVPASTYLLTKKTHRNFRLLFEAKQTRGEKFPPTMHSAVAVLGEKFQENGQAFGFRGPLLMFCHDWGIWDAHRRNRIYPAGRDHDRMWQHPSEKVGDWNQIELLVVSDHIRLVNNGELIVDFIDAPGMLKSSPIGLQLHSNKSPQEYFFRGLILCQNPENRLITLKAHQSALKGGEWMRIPRYRI